MSTITTNYMDKYHCRWTISHKTFCPTSYVQPRPELHRQVDLMMGKPDRIESRMQKCEERIECIEWDSSINAEWVAKGTHPIWFINTVFQDYCSLLFDKCWWTWEEPKTMNSLSAIIEWQWITINSETNTRTHKCKACLARIMQKAIIRILLFVRIKEKWLTRPSRFGPWKGPLSDMICDLLTEFDILIRWNYRCLVDECCIEFKRLSQINIWPVANPNSLSTSKVLEWSMAVVVQKKKKKN